MIDLRHAVDADVPNVVTLLEDLDRFYGGTNFPPRALRQRQVRELLFGPFPAARVLLAVDGMAVVGMASYSLLWPASGVTASLYLKELYVQHTHRQQGIGRQLMTRICRIAAETGCSRVEWTTDRDNTDAQRFYEQLGVPANTKKIMYRLDGIELSRLADNNNDRASADRPY